MAAQEGRNFSIGLGLQDLLDFNGTRSGSSCRIVIGKDGSKVELIEYVSSLIPLFNIPTCLPYITDLTNSSTISS